MSEEEKKVTEAAEEPTAPKNTESSATPSAPAPEKEDKRERRGGERRGRGRRDRAPREPKEFEEAILQIDRVTRVVKGGRRLRFRVSVVIGDQKGRVGFGIGKAAEVMIGIQKAVAMAKKSLVKVPISNGTIPHEVNEVYKASRVLLFPAPVGKGVIAGGAVRRILELVGVKDVLSKVHGSRNKINVARATMNALKKFQNVIVEKEVSNEEPKEKEAKSSEQKKPKASNTSPKKPATKKTLSQPKKK